MVLHFVLFLIVGSPSANAGYDCRNVDSSNPNLGTSTAFSSANSGTISGLQTQLSQLGVQNNPIVSCCGSEVSLNTQTPDTTTRCGQSGGVWVLSTGNNCPMTNGSKGQVWVCSAAFNGAARSTASSSTNQNDPGTTCQTLSSGAPGQTGNVPIGDYSNGIPGSNLGQSQNGKPVLGQESGVPFSMAAGQKTFQIPKQLPNGTSCSNAPKICQSLALCSHPLDSSTDTSRLNAIAASNGFQSSVKLTGTALGANGLAGAPAPGALTLGGPPAVTPGLGIEIYEQIACPANSDGSCPSATTCYQNNIAMGVAELAPKPAGNPGASSISGGE